jgi:hypothetical protein
LSAEREQLLRELADLHSVAADLGSTARLSPAREQLAQLEETLRAADQEHAQRVQDILKQLHQVGNVSWIADILAPPMLLLSPHAMGVA